MKRRQFLAGSAALTVLPKPALATAPLHRLRAEPVAQQVLLDGDPITQMLGFNGSMPGPAIKVPRGELSQIEVENALDQGTAVHWHGIRLKNSMDGVPGLTQPLIPAGGRKTYSFVPPDAGTFWYHSHYISHEQVARGLVGPLIVEEDTPINVDHDVTAVVSDWLMERDGSLIDDYDDPRSVSHAGLLGTFARAFFSQDRVQVGDRIRLRLINAATNRIFPLAVTGAEGLIVALDGMALQTPRRFEEIMLAPAQRADLILDVTGPLRLDMMSRQGPYELATLDAQGQNTARDAAAPIRPLPAPDLTLGDAPQRSLTLTMMGGAMGGQHGGDKIWAFNDVSDMPEQPFARIARGEVVKLSMVNDTSFPHGIHLHGHHFAELAPDGTQGDLRDTTLIFARQSRDILCRFDNPGKWMLHCHMLSHAFGGMRTWIEVV